MMRRLWWALFPFLLANAADSAGDRWWRHVQELADDKYEGRAATTEGHRRAADYVASQFKALGLKPAGENGYIQKVPLRVRRIREAESSLMLVRPGVQEWLQLGEDAYFNLRAEPAADVQAPAAFVGYGLTVPELGHDDLEGIDLKGRIAVFLWGGPASVPGSLRAHYQSLAERWPFLRRAGAVGMASILDPTSMDIPWDRLRQMRLEPFMSLAGARFEEAQGMRLSVTINPAAADRLFGGTGHSMEEILAAARDGKPLPRFPLAFTLRATVRADLADAASENVAAILPGRDPKLRGEYVVLSAHLDHLGTSGSASGDAVYNGALDNAAGVASLFEIARQLRTSPPRRSVLFLAVTAEEKGLLGSKYFAAASPVRADAIVAAVNLDMLLPLHPLKLLTVYGLEESSLGGDARAAAKQFGVGILPDSQPERGLFTRSDQYSFIRSGIPSLSFRFGFERGSAEESLHREWISSRYHAPSDDVSQPVDRAAAARLNRLVAALAVRIGDAAGRPQWNQGSFFRRFRRTAD